MINPHLSRLSPDEQGEFDRLLAAFEQAWQPPELLALLPGGGAVLDAVRAELAAADLEHRLLAGQAVWVQQYLDRVPGLKEDLPGVCYLIAREYAHRLRKSAQQPPAEYARRFPAYDGPELRGPALGAALGAITTAPQSAPAEPGQSPPPDLPVMLPGTRDRGEAPHVPGYEVLGVLGRGGMGVVYKARHLALKRVVALKMIRADHADEQERERFRFEAQAVARLQHPNIVAVFEVGEQGGQPFFALEFVEGGSLARKLAGTPQPPRASAALVHVLARAMHVAHLAGIVHRDLKPANVLLTAACGLAGTSEQGAAKPQAARQIPKIADFGLAKQLETETGHTQTGAIVGTPSYMAPEQAEGKKDVGPAADIYALGSILYEALTGRPPFRGTTMLETLEQVRSRDPVPPSRLQPGVPRDLETICLKCLEKLPARRYATADELADDLGRFLADEPIRARPVPPWERGLKWARARRPAVAFLSGLSAFVTVAALVLVTWQLGRAVAAERAAKKETRDKETALVKERQERYARNITLADLEYQANHLAQAEQLLEQCPVELRGWEWYYLRQRCRQNLMTLPGHAGGVWGLAVSPDGSLLASAGADRSVGLWNPATGQKVRTLRGHTQVVRCLAFSPDGKKLATAGSDLTARVWDPTTGKELLTLRGHKAVVTGVVFGPDGTRLVTSSADETIRIWDAGTGKELSRLDDHMTHVTSVALDPLRRYLASASPAGVVTLWNAYTNRFVRNLFSRPGKARAVAFSPDGRFLGSAGGEVNVWAVETGKRVLALQEPDLEGRCLAFSPDGRRLASAASDHSVRVWDAGTGHEVLRFRGHTDWVRALAFSPDGQRLYSAGDDGVIRAWDATSSSETRSFPGLSRDSLGLAFSADGRRLATTTAPFLEEERVTVLDVRTGRTHYRLPSEKDMLTEVAFSPDGKWLVTSSNEVLPPAGTEGERFRKAWEKPTRVRASLIDRAKGRQAEGKPTLGARDRYVLELKNASAGKPRHHPGPGNVTIRDAASGKKVRTMLKQGVACLTFSPDGRRLAASDRKGGVAIWEAASGNKLLAFAAHDDDLVSLAFSPGGKRLLSAGGKEVKVSDSTSGETLCTFRHDTPVNVASFSPDGRRVASASEGQERKPGPIEVWDAESGEVVFTLVGHADEVTDLAFSRPDGRRLASASADRTVKLWDTDTGRNLLSLRGHARGVMSVRFSPDGRQLVSAGEDRALLLWDTEQVLPDAEAAKQLAVGWHLHETEDCLRMDATDAQDEDRAPEQIRYLLVSSPRWRTRTDLARQWFAAHFHLDRLLRVRPRDGSLFYNRAAVRAELGQWDDAGQDFNRAVALLPGDPVPVACQALLRYREGDRGGYQQGCARLVELIGATWKAEPNFEAARVCLSGTQSNADLVRLLRLVEKAVAAAPKDADARGILGAALYRANRPEEALRTLQEALRLAKGGGDRPWEWFFLALAEHRLGNHPEAQGWLRRAAGWLDDKTAEVLPRAWAGSGRLGSEQGGQVVRVGWQYNPGPQSWLERLRFEVLRREADALVLGQGLTWPAEALRQGKISAPDLGKVSPWRRLDLRDPKSGLPVGSSQGNMRGYEAGKYVVRTPGGPSFYAWNCPEQPRADFACEVVGRVVGLPSDAWMVCLSTPRHGILIALDGRGTVTVGPNPWEQEKYRGPFLGPLAHPAIKKGGQSNRLLLVLRGATLEIYVNRVAVCDPIWLTGS